MKRALEVFNRIPAEYPDNAVLNDHMGMALYKDGKKEEALTHLKKSVAAQGDFLGKVEAAATLGKM